MNQEKFVNSYIELLTATITESIQKNLVLQTQKKIAEQELNEANESLKQFDNKNKQELTVKQNEIDSLKHQLGEMKKQRDISVAESGEIKKSVEHVDTFKNELVKARKHNENLVTKINELESQLEETVKTFEPLIQEKIKIIESLTTELAKNLKPEYESKKIDRKNPFREITTTEDAGSF
jgi:predicted  nucleic acid-binding Zn-ribbon protein